MKLRTTTPASIPLPAKLALVFASLLIAVAIPLQMTQQVSADKYDDQINALQRDIDSYNAQAATLATQAKTLQSAVAELQNQTNVIQAQIDISQAKYDKLVAQIAETEQKIKDNQDALGKTIADMYVDEKITPIEMLASSKNVGDYIDKQEYRSSVRDELSSTIKKIKDLKTQLVTQKADVGRVLSDQKNQHDAKAQKQAEQQNLLNETQGQESAYQQLTSKSNSEISQLRSQQAAEIAARARSNGGGYASSPGNGSNGGYPTAWNAAPLDSYVDDWGMFTRECTSYAAFKVNQAYRNMPYWGGIGNANQWPANARAVGIKTSSVPAAGTVGVISSGTYGHVAWVESVNADGTINISHYNVNWSGNYSEWYNLDPSFFDTYIYFGG